MKIRQILTLLILVLASSSFAQRFNAGLTAGLVTSDIPGTDPYDHDVDYTKLGFTVGVLVNTALSENNIVQMEINYIQKGASALPDSNNNHSFSLKFNYVEVPLVYRRRLHINVFKKPNTNLQLEVGASYARLFNYSYIDQTHYPQTLAPGTYSLNDVSLLAGIEYDFTPHIQFCIRYSNSVIPVLTSASSNAQALQFFWYTFNKGNNVDFQFSVKFIFGQGLNKAE